MAEFTEANKQEREISIFLEKYNEIAAYWCVVRASVRRTWYACGWLWRGAAALQPLPARLIGCRFAQAAHPPALLVSRPAAKNKKNKNA